MKPSDVDFKLITIICVSTLKWNRAFIGHYFSNRNFKESMWRKSSVCGNMQAEQL